MKTCKTLLAVALLVYTSFLFAKIEAFSNAEYLFPGKRITLPLLDSKGNPITNYRISSAGTYTLTTNGEVVDASLCLYDYKTQTEDLDITLILDNCHLAPTENARLESTTDKYYPSIILAPIVIDRNSSSTHTTNLTIQFTGQNSLSPQPSDGYMMSQAWHGAIMASSNLEYTTSCPLKLNLTIEEHPLAPSDSSLTIAGRTTRGSDPYIAYPPLYFPEYFTDSESNTYATNVSVTLNTGNLHLLSSTAEKTSVALVAPLVEAKTILIDGATINATFASCTADSAYSLTKALLLKKPAQCSLFKCSIFQMTSGTLLSQDAGAINLNEKKYYSILSSKTPYDTRFTFPDALLTTPQAPSGGRCIKDTSTHFYGLPEEANINCFTGTPQDDELTLDKTLNNTLVVNAPDAELHFADAEVDPVVSLNAATLLELPLQVTDDGFALEPYAVGIHKLTLSDNALYLTAALQLPEEIGTEAQTYLLTILQHTDEASAIVFAENATFTRSTATDLYLTTVKIVDNPLSTRKTAFYTFKLSTAK